MNPDQLGEALEESAVLLNGVVQAVPEIGEVSVAELIEFLALAKNNRVQLLTIHKTLESVKKTQPQTPRRQMA